MDNLQSAKETIKALEDALQRASEGQGNPDALREAQASMKKLEADLNQAAQALNLSDSASTVTGVTPSTTTAGSGANSEGPELSVAPHSSGVQKLSLAQRKNIRDEFENKKDEWAQRISKVMGVPWTVHIDVPGVMSYAGDGSARDNPGGTFNNFFSSNTDNLERWIKKHKDEGRDALNRAAFHHVVTLEPAAAKDAPTTSCDVSGGKLRMLFNHEYLGWSASDAMADRKLSDALDKVDVAGGAGTSAPDKLPFKTRISIRDEYEAEIPPVLELARKQLHQPELQFTPNFAGNFAFMKAWAADELNEDEAARMGDGWEEQFGARTKDYFAAFADFLERKKFARDDMMREGFAEAVESLNVQMRVIDKAKMSGKNSSCEIAIADGICYLQTSPDGWGWSISSVAENLLDEL